MNSFKKASLALCCIFSLAACSAPQPQEIETPVESPRETLNIQLPAEYSDHYKQLEKSENKVTFEANNDLNQTLSISFDEGLESAPILIGYLMQTLPNPDLMPSEAKDYEAELEKMGWTYTKDDLKEVWMTSMEPQLGNAYTAVAYVMELRTGDVMIASLNLERPDHQALEADVPVAEYEIFKKIVAELEF